MADPEVELPRAQDDVLNSGAKTGIRLDSTSTENLEKGDSKLSLEHTENEECDGDSTVEYHFLTFETELPHPTSITPPTPGAPLHRCGKARRVQDLVADSYV